MLVKKKNVLFKTFGVCSRVSVSFDLTSQRYIVQ